MNPYSPPRSGRSDLVKAETYTPALLQTLTLGLEAATHSRDVWHCLVDLGRDAGLPFVDYVSTGDTENWRNTLFIRTSHDSGLLNHDSAGSQESHWSYFHNHAMHYLTPVLIGLEFAEDYRHLPDTRIRVLELAAANGMRAGLLVPLRSIAPPQTAMITFMGDHSKTEMQALLDRHGWALNAGALMAHQRFVQLYSAEFAERFSITPKQRQLIELIGLGHQDKVIADSLGVSVSAVRQRMHALLKNTGLHTRSELAALAMSLGLLPDPLKRPDGAHEPEAEMDDGLRTQPVTDPFIP